MMATRMTRGMAAREAAFLASDKENTTPQVSSPPISSGFAHSKMQRRSTSVETVLRRQTPKLKAEDDYRSPLPAPTSVGRKGAVAKKAGVDVVTDREVKNNQDSFTPNSKVSKKRKRAAKAEDEEYPELLHNMGSVLEAPGEVKGKDPEIENFTMKKSATKKSSDRIEMSETLAPSKPKSARDAKDADRAVTQLATVKANFEQEVMKREKAMASGKKSKSESYGLCEGETPFPNWQRPTPQDCQEVFDILLKHHPDIHPPPRTIPPPSEFIAGCGEVRSILDALIRTRLSASTTGRNSNAAYQGMVKHYGLLKSGVGKGSVDYNAVRLAPVQDLFYAIKNGGLAVSKSADIKVLLDLVYEENQARRRELLAAQATSNHSMAPRGAETENDAQKAAEIKLAEEENLSLDHYYALPTYDAIYKFMSYPGIGVKTAACVAMFCMQRPCFAVDTHVFRLSKWLGWVPPPEGRKKGEKAVDRDTTFSHLEVRVPDHLKYMLHQLFLKHGKTCPRCRGNTGEGSANWGEGCVIDHLVQRTGPRKGGADSPVKARPTKSAVKGRKSVSSDEEEDDDDEEMPDLHDDNEDAEDLKSSLRGKKPDTRTKNRVKDKPSINHTTTKIPPYGASATTATVEAAKRASPRKSVAASTKPKRKPTPTNGWKGGKAVGSCEADRES